MAPYWYRIVKAAHYYGTPPWEIARHPWHWVEWAEQAQDVEARADAERERQRKARQQKGL